MHFTHANFQILGYVGTIREVGKTLKVRVSKTETWKDNSGQRMERTIWNTVTLFERSTAGFAWLKENLKPGDLVHVRGRIGESNYAKDGQTVYETSLTADRFAVVPVGKDG